MGKKKEQEEIRDIEEVLDSMIGSADRILASIDNIQTMLNEIQKELTKTPSPSKEEDK